MATADKLSYLNTTKGKIKDSINITGANITNETTFRNYAVLLKDKLAELLVDPSPIWDNFPKTNATGTDIQVNTYNSLFEYELEGNTEQDGTPTPDTPINIDVVSGLQEVEICGKNIFDRENSETNKGLVWSSGATNTTTNGVVSPYIPIKANTKIKANYKAQIMIYDTNKGYLGCYHSGNVYNTTTGNTTDTATMPNLSELAYVRFSFRPSDNNNIDMTSQNIMVNIGETLSPYEPYKGKTYELNLGKNLLHIQSGSASHNGLDATFGDGIITVGGLSTATSFLTIISNKVFLPKGTYTISAFNEASYNDSGFDLRITGKNGNNIYGRTYLNAINSSATFTLTEDLSEGCLQVRASSGDNLNNFVIKPQLEKGSAKTSYSKYFDPIELCKIGTYQDKIFKGSGKNLCDNNIEQGSLNSSGSTTSSTTRCRTINFIDVLPSTTYTLSLMSNNTIQTIVYEYNGDTFVRQENSNWSNVPYTFTTGDTTTKIKLVFRISGNATIVPSDFSNVQLELGNQATDYEPYNAKDKWLLHKEIGKVIIDGTGTWTTQTPTGFYRYGTSISSLNNSSSLASTLIIKTNYYKGIVFDNRNTDTNETIYPTNNNSDHNIFFNTMVATNINDFKTWLNTHNTIVYYVLANPTTEEITNSELVSELNSIELIDGENNITITGDLAAILNLTVLERE